ncbi:MAG: hypothetical protein JKY27_12140 [Magnetovibrio sp.]|nr:hypothetical protein [Magnetovibrio sp.]
MASGTIGNLAQRLATIHQAASGPSFELQFSQLQNTVIRRLNDEIQKVNEAGGSKAEMLKLQRDGRKLAENLPIVEKFLFDTESNKGRLSTIYDKITSLVSKFTDDANMSATDVANFNTERQETVDEMNRLWQLSYVGFTDGDTIRRLKNDISVLEGLTPVEGVVDPEGTDPATNANRSVLSSLETLQTQTSTAQTVTLNSIKVIFDIHKGMISDMFTIQADVTEINSSAQLAKLAEAEQIQLRYAALLESISLSYDVASSFSENLAKSLSSPRPEKGSVLNLFS